VRRLAVLGQRSDVPGAGPLLHRSSPAAASRAPLARQLADGEATAALSFAGQGEAWLPELRTLAGAEAWVQGWVALAEQVLREVAADPEVRWSGLLDPGVDVRRWVAGDAAPPAWYLASTPISMPLILLTQVARLVEAQRRGLGAAFEAGSVVATTGYSQGLAAAALAAESPDGAITTDRLVDYLRLMAWHGFDAAAATQDALGLAPGESPMAVVTGPDAATLVATARGLNGSGPAFVALHNDRKRHVLSGSPAALSEMREALERRAQAEAAARKAGQHGGRVLTVAWEPVATSAAFHTPLVEGGFARTLARARDLDLRVGPAGFARPVYDPGSERRIDQAEDPTEAVLRSIFLATGRWQTTLSRLADEVRPDALLDLGPGVGIAGLSAGALRGSGLAVFGLADEVAAERLFAEPRAPRPTRWADFAPRLARLGDGRVVVDNAFTRATGTPPILLPGMTPTTVDAGIVAAAANAGFTSELAGGGQVTEAMFEERLRELGELLEPGAEIVFNALLLDAYLWGLHLGDKRVVQRAREQGHPIAGVTISAGVPEVEAGVRLIDELAGLGMRIIAFKPGTPAQLDQVVAIARAAPQHTLFVHLEGGKAGGHHSWEDLDDLLLDTYHKVRAEPNLILCAGGGVADEARAVELLLGTWSERHGLLPMPVDAIFVGTLAMACREATASPSVKAALAAAPGDLGWVGRGQAKGGVTSGQSQLNADIHYLDNAAARCGRLLDQVAGDAEAVARRRDEIVEALSRTAKPWLGDLEAMTWADLLERMVELMATGRHGRYEDGAWPDLTYRQRVLDTVHRAEARLAGLAVNDGLDRPVASALPTPADLDDPAAALAAFLARWPAARTTRIHPADVGWFVHRVCARPGKPVPFVPVIDADVRRWFKADSLWQAQDDRFDADQVLVIPGPAGVAGIRAADEPVADLLGRFDRAFVAALEARGAKPRALDALPTHRAIAAPPRPPGVRFEPNGHELVVRVVDAAAADGWLAWLGARFRGPLAGLLCADTLTEGGRVVPNPVARLFAPVTGATLILDPDEDGALVRATYRPLGADGERAELIRTSDGLTLGLACEADEALDFELAIRPRLTRYRHTFDLVGAGMAGAIEAFYRRVLFDAPPEPVALFEPATAEVTVPADLARAYRRVTGWRAERPAAGPAPALALNQVFSIAWPAVYRTLACEDLAAGLLRLVHLDHAVAPLAAWPLRPDEAIAVAAAVTRVEDHPGHRLVTVVAELSQGGAPAARLTAGFHIRGPFGESPFAARAQERVHQTVALDTAGRLAFLTDHEALTFTADPAVGDRLTFDLTLGERRPRTGPARFTAAGAIRRGDDVIGAVALDLEAALAEHPVCALLAVLAEGDDAERATPSRLLAEAEAVAPAAMDAFAEVGGDRNPIHRSALAARLAGLEAPIVHGMWTAARLHAFVVDAVAGGDAGRVGDFSARFSAPVLPGEALVLRASRVAARDGDLVLTAEARARRGDAEHPVAAARVVLRPGRTAYVFPGQGIQQREMGMAAYLRSPAARRVWDRADAHCREHLGFSILRVVRENPRELRVGDERLAHPRGVLNLTQLTQVAMAVLAYAQVAELREAGVYVEDAVLCGHSVGEYNALSAGAQVLPLEAVVSIVYQRGRVMHSLVPRDAEGESGFGMGVVRPHYAGLDHAGAEALVDEVARETGGFLEIVNYNVRGRQYSVTGHTGALARLAEVLEARRRPGAKPPWVEVPGVDVPFHSRRLLAGVPGFRAALERHFPPSLDPGRLVDRYIPNLIARPFALTEAFTAAVRDAVEGDSRARLDAILADWPAWSARPGALTRALVVELLAWQFASPVRWIETQEQMFAPANGLGAPGLGVQTLVEIGVGYQPTLANMARATLSAMRRPVRVLNAEAERAEVFAEDTDPAPAPADAPDADAVADAPSPAAPTPAVEAAPRPAPNVQQAPADAPLTHGEALTSLLALQARLRPEQLGAAETIDGVFDGVSSRRNQALMDIGAEFDVGTIDRAHETPLGELAAELARRGGTYRPPGRYLAQAHEDALKRVLGRAGLGARDVAAYLEATYGFGPGLVGAAVDTLALETRPGASARGGDLGGLGDEAPATKDAGRALLDRAVAALGARRGQAFGKLGAAEAAAGGIVDAAAVAALEERVFGPDGALLGAARALARAAGRDLDAPAPAPDPALLAAERELEALTAELGAELTALVAPRFDAARHVVFTSPWAAAQRDLAALAFDRLNHRISDEAVAAELARLAPRAAEPRVAATAGWFADRADAASLPAFAGALRAFAGARVAPRLPVGPLAAELFPAGDPTRSLLEAAAAGDLDLRGRTALVTGASPDSIAVVIVGWLLAAGARVIATTTSYHRERLAFYQALYERHAAPGAELHVVPFNQASFGDGDALLDWLFRAETEQAGATVRVLKPAFEPDILVPFAALKDLGTLDQLGARAEASLRAMVLGTERLIGGVARRLIAQGGGRTCHVLLPLSPNHGAFGGDGAYAESKAALEVLLAKWRSERDAWARAVTFVGARIGWVRGTGLMAGNDAVAPRLEAATGIRTFSNDEMGALLAALLTEPARARAAGAPVVADLTGGFDRVPDLKAAVDGVRDGLEAELRAERERDDLARAEAARLGLDAAPDARPVTPLPAWPLPAGPEPDHALPWPGPVTAAPEEMVVIVGYGEVGPGGSARTRFDLEVGERLSAPAVLELAWTMGLVRFDEGARGGTWVDVESGDAVAEEAIADRYRDRVRAGLGVRFIEPATTGFDPERAPVFERVYLERDMTFRVGSEDEARAFTASDPEGTRARYDEDAGAWVVTRLAGGEIRVPREARLSRRVAGQLPTGFDLGRFGFPGEMVENVDPVALMNITATVDAFLAAGTTPEELLAYVHPARVATTQGSGMGGMRSLHRLYCDHLLGRERQTDILQETLINVVFAYAATTFVGSYGPMAHPVAACATAALSLEDACDKILLGKADVVMTGGWDDLSEEGVIGFGDMSATADTDKMLAMGLEPDQMSRANDRRRRGFVEAQGGGALILARGDVAQTMGLPVYGVLAWASSFGDGINRSIPAPGIGALAAALGGARSPLARALRRLGLSADDIALVSKHDTSTQANDPNESSIHHDLQDALGRTPGNPLMVISQKTLTGHSKGGAAAWQTIGLCQALSGGVVPPNRNLESPDPALERYRHLLFTNRRLDPGAAYPLRAGLVTSLGFGHVSALLAVVHPAAFAHALPEAEREAWAARVAARQEAARARAARILLGREPLYAKRVERRFAAPDGSEAQRDEERAMLLDPSARLDPATGTFRAAGPHADASGAGGAG